MTNKISVTRALARIKQLRSRIPEIVQNARFATVAIGSGSLQSLPEFPNLTVDQFNDKAKASVSSVNDSISELIKLRGAVNASNAKTVVTIGGKEMTVAEAIERKAVASMEQELLYAAIQQNRSSTATFTRAREVLEQKIENAVTQMYGAAEKRKVNEGDVEIASAPVSQRFAPTLIDPLSLSTWIEDRKATLGDFLAEVDFVLSESNAKTDIEV